MDVIIPHLKLIYQITPNGYKLDSVNILRVTIISLMGRLNEQQY